MMNISGKIVIAQSNSGQSDLHNSLLKRNRFQVTQAIGGEAVVNILNGPSLPDLFVLDNQLQGPTPAEICRMAKSNPKLSLIPFILVVGPEEIMEGAAELTAGFVEILPHPINIDLLESRIHSFLLLRQLGQKTEDTENILTMFKSLMDSKDPTTRGHAGRVAEYVVQLGRAIGLSEAELVTLRKGGLLHDVGKLSIPDPILNKPGKFTPGEFEIMKTHPMLGCEICQNLSFLSDAIPLIKHHHEKLNGAGYPAQLKGSQISIMTRIVTIVDIYDALRSKRPYKLEFSIDRSFKVMWEEVEKGWWDKDLLTAWEKIVRSNHH